VVGSEESDGEEIEMETPGWAQRQLSKGGTSKPGSAAPASVPKSAPEGAGRKKAKLAGLGLGSENMPSEGETSLKRRRRRRVKRAQGRGGCSI